MRSSGNYFLIHRTTQRLIMAGAEMVPDIISAPYFIGLQEIWAPITWVPQKYEPQEIWSPHEKFFCAQTQFLDPCFSGTKFLGDQRVEKKASNRKYRKCCISDSTTHGLSKPPIPPSTHHSPLHHCQSVLDFLDSKLSKTAYDTYLELFSQLDSCQLIG